MTTTAEHAARLRRLAEATRSVGRSYNVPRFLDEAADRLEELETEVRRLRARPELPSLEVDLERIDPDATIELELWRWHVLTCHSSRLKLAHEEAGR